MAVEKVDVGQVATRNIRHNVRVLLRDRDMTSADLAAAVGMGESSMSECLNGKRHIRADEVARIAHVLGVEPGLLYRDSIISTRCKPEIVPPLPGQQEFQGMTPPAAILAVAV